jgi:hypothetical protein
MPTTSLMPLPKQQFLSAVGAPLVGGSIYTYAAGTNNPKATYTDSAGTVPQANPIPLNARGEPNSPIYWSGAYKVEVRDLLGNVVYTVDNFNTDPAGVWGFMTNLASTVGASLMGFLQAGAGAIKRTVQDKLRDTLSAKDFGAKGDGVTDDFAALQAYANYISNHGEQDYCPAFTLSPGVYKTSAPIVFNSQSVYIRADGIARIEPMELTNASAFPLISIPGSASRVVIRDLTLYMYGSNCTGISAPNLWRQASIENNQFIGGDTGIDLAGGGAADKWGIVIRKNRFQDCGYGIRWIINGQTGTIGDNLYFNCRVMNAVIVGGASGSQLTIINTVNENAIGINGRAMSIDGVKEVTMIGVQGEHIGYRNTDTGLPTDYDYYFSNCTVIMIGCRLWGGSYGSVAPGNSRGFGVYLDNTRLKLVNSRIYSYRKVALKMVNGSVCETDLQSQIDFRCLAGTPKFECSADLGPNQIVSGDYGYWNSDASNTGKPFPLGWARAGAAGVIARTTANLLEPASQAAIDLTASSEPHWTNFFDVSPGEWCTFRCSAKAAAGGGYILAQDQTGAGWFAMYDPTAPNNRLVANASTDPQDATKNNGALLVWSFQIPAGVTSMRIKHNGGMWLESLALYRGVKANVTNAGTVYSDNDSSFGCWVHLAPPIPFKPAPKLITDTLTVADIRGTFQRGVRMEYANPAPGGYGGLVCTTAGAGGSTAVIKTTNPISP